MPSGLQYFEDVTGNILVDTSYRLPLLWAEVPISGSVNPSGSINVPGLSNGPALAFFVNPNLSDNPTVVTPTFPGTTVSWSGAPIGFNGVLLIWTY